MSASSTMARLTASEWAAMLRDPVKDQRYLKTALGPSIQEFLSYMENERAASPVTVHDYELILARLAVLFPDTSAKEFTTDDIRKGRDLFPPASRRTALSVFKSCFKWLYREEKIPRDPAARIEYPKRGPKKIHNVFTAAEQASLVTKGPDKSLGRAIELSHRASVLLLLDAGLRASEFLSLTLGNVDLLNHWIIVERGKGGKSRVVPFAAEDRLAKAVRFFAATPIPRVKAQSEEEDDLEEHLPSDETHFLYPITVNRTGLVLTKPWKELTYTPFWHWWRAVCKRAKVRYRSPHMNRHTLLTAVVRETGAERAQMIAGHASISTTVDIYSHLNIADAREAVEALARKRGTA